MKEKKINILGISETKLSINNAHFAFKDHFNYKCFTSSSQNNNYGSGVAIIMNKDLAKHVGKVDRIEGRIIAIQLFFKKCKLIIIQIYLPSNKRESNKYQQIIRQLILTEVKHKSKIILMGDFNIASNPSTDRPYASKQSNS